MWPLVHLFYRVKITAHGEARRPAWAGDVRAEPRIHWTTGSSSLRPDLWRWRLAVPPQRTTSSATASRLLLRRLATAFPLAREGVRSSPVSSSWAARSTASSPCSSTRKEAHPGRAVQRSSPVQGLDRVEGGHAGGPDEAQDRQRPIIDHLDRSGAIPRRTAGAGNVESCLAKRSTSPRARRRTRRPSRRSKRRSRHSSQKNEPAPLGTLVG